MFRWVVTRRDDERRDVLVVGVHLHAGGRDRPEILDVQADTRQSTLGGVGHHLARRSGVVGDGYARAVPVGAPARPGGQGHLEGVLRCQRLVDDAANPARPEYLHLLNAHTRGSIVIPDCPDDSDGYYRAASTIPDMDTQQLIDALRDAEAVKFGEFELSHGGTSNYYVDKYVFETNPDCLELIAQAFADALGDGETKLAGVALGAVPLVAVTSVETGRPYVIARKQQKEYGTANLIEGNLVEGEEVIILEDIATTGQSAVDAAEALREAGAVVNRVLVVVDREEGAAENMAEHGLQLESLVSASQLLADAPDDVRE